VTIDASLQVKLDGVWQPVGGGDGGTPEVPTDWLSLPTLTAGTEKMVGLVAVWPGASNPVSVAALGRYTVDWGDGSAPENYDATAMQDYGSVVTTGTLSPTGSGSYAWAQRVIAGRSTTITQVKFGLNIATATTAQMKVWIRPDAATAEATTATPDGVVDVQSGTSGTVTIPLTTPVALVAGSTYFVEFYSTGGNASPIGRIQLGTTATYLGDVAAPASGDAVWRMTAGTTTKTTQAGKTLAVTLVEGGGVAQATHTYDYANCTGLTTEGFRQAIITITPQAGETLTSLNLSIRPDNVKGNPPSPWLDVSVVGANLTSLTLYDSVGVYPGYLRRFTFVGPSGLTSAANVFNNARMLSTVVGTAWTATVTNFTSMFANCHALRTVPLLDTALGTNFTNMFQNCSTLLTIPLLDTSHGVTFTGMFDGCASLLTLPDLDIHLGTVATAMFQNCYALALLPTLNAAALTSGSLASAFSGCDSLQSVVLTGMRFSFSVANAKLSADALNALYTGLASGVTGQTVTVTGNVGTATDDPTIATAKGWTVA
jgi:hypothetical protein